MANIKIYCDGGSRGNPGPSSIAFIIFEEDIKTYEEGRFIGKGTNNTAEYTAVIDALSWLSKNNKVGDSIGFFLDSELVVNQLNGKFKVQTESIFQLARRVKNLERFFKNKISYQHIPREENKDADALVNKTMDEFFA